MPQVFSSTTLLRTPQVPRKCNYWKSPHTREERSSRPAPSPGRYGCLKLTAVPAGSSCRSGHKAQELARAGCHPLRSPEHTLGPGAVPARAASLPLAPASETLGLGVCPAEGVKRMFSVPSRAQGHFEYPCCGEEGTVWSGS